MSENDDLIEEQLNAYYSQTVATNPDQDKKELRLSVTAGFIQAYMDSIFQAIYGADTQEDRMAAVFVIEMMKNLQEDLSQITEDMPVEEKTKKIINALELIDTPSYDAVVSTSVRVLLIDRAKDHFATMADFLKD